MARFEMSGEHLKLKYRADKPKGRFRADYSGNQGKPVRGTPPVGLPKVYRGKTRFR